MNDTSCILAVMVTPFAPMIEIQAEPAFIVRLGIIDHELNQASKDGDRIRPRELPATPTRKNFHFDFPSIDDPVLLQRIEVLFDSLGILACHQIQSEISESVRAVKAKAGPADVDTSHDVPFPAAPGRRGLLRKGVPPKRPWR